MSGSVSPPRRFSLRLAPPPGPAFRSLQDPLPPAERHKTCLISLPAPNQLRLPNRHPGRRLYPIVWTDVLQSYSTSAAVDFPVAVFGALSFWWMGEHGSPSIDTSEHVWFANDQLAVRFIEEIDFDYAATDATAALITAAS